MAAPLTRRQVLAQIGYMGISLPLAPVQVSASRLASTTNAVYFNFTIGEISATVVTDGHMLFSPVQPIWAPQATLSQLQGLLRDNFLRTDGIEVAFNVLMLRVGQEIILVDTGTGSGFGPMSGHLGRNLATIGIQPDDVTAIVLTHAHADHIGGVVDVSGNIAFPKATVWIAKAEYDFWMKTKPESSNEISYRNLMAVRSKLAYFGDRELLFGCIQTRLAPGHTPGHSLLTIRSGKDELVHIGDTAHNHILMFAQPDWTVAFDTVPAEAAKTRKRIFTDLAIRRQQAFGYHLPWPGLGHIRAIGNHYEWLPTAFSTPY